jgi:hypothetical protein
VSAEPHPGPRAPWHDLGDAVRVLAPPEPPSRFAAFLDRTLETGAEPFAESRLDTLGRLSSAFLADPVLRQDAASVAVAFWLRRAQLARLKADFEQAGKANPTVVRVPVGRVFHIAPSNVDTLFVYSWALSYLCGNANVVRVSQDLGPIVLAMLDVFSGLSSGDAALRDHNRFVTYAHDEAVTAAISAWCSHRVIWGGDETVAALRPLPLNPHASERVFGSKFSFAALDADRYLAAEATERARVAGGFFNDLFWFDQMACSSPQVVFWVGAAASAARAAEAFETELQAEVARRGFAPTASNAVHRRAYAFDVAAVADVRVTLEHPGFVGIHVLDPDALTRDICGGGVVRHVRVETLDDVSAFVHEVDQTLTHWGFDAAALRVLAGRAGARGLDRVVPIGEALAFDVVWDGFGLVDDFVRRVRVRA